MQIDPVARVSKITICLLVSALIFSSMSFVFHGSWDGFSYTMFGLAAFTGLLALIQIMNAVAVRLPKTMAAGLHWIHAMIFEVFALLAIFFLRFFKGSFFNRAKQGRPILLVHGYCNNGSVWTYQRKMLAKNFLGPIYTIDLGHPFRSIREYAQKIKLKAEQIRKETGRSDLILVGHSMGGLVSSFYALQLAPHDSVTDVITIGSPLAGTFVASIGIGQNAREMQRRSELVSDLNDRLRQESLIRFYHIATKTDLLVIPSGSALIGVSPEREFLFEDIGHASLLFSPRVAALLTEWIKASLVASDLRVS